MGVSGRTETFYEWQGERKFFPVRIVIPRKRTSSYSNYVMPPFALYHPNENLLQGHPTTVFCEYLFGEANIA